MDAARVDAVVYPGFLSDMYDNDGATSQHSSDRGTGVLTSNVGLPTVVVPVGTNGHGYSTSMQLVGRAWADADVLGMGYALEQQARGRQVTVHAPALAERRDGPPHALTTGRPVAGALPGRSGSAPGRRQSTVGLLLEEDYSK